MSGLGASEAMKREMPLIGVTMRHEIETERFYLARYYGEALAAAGALPVHISLIPDAGYLGAVLERLDGILLPGSASDVNPLLYGQEPQVKLGSVHTLRDETDLLLLRASEERRIPLFAICYGMQVLNVQRGGTLIQDISSSVPGALKHEQGAPRERPSHSVRLQSESLLAALAGEGRVVVNSHHHQAIETLGRDLRATAWSSDGLIEAVEDTREGAWVVGVQWHPELGWEKDKLSGALFRSFVGAASRYASDKQ
jgi:putative glutamine amidotransferase